MTELTVKKREAVGKKVKAIRRQEMVPGVLYGQKQKNEPVAVDKSAFEKAFLAAGETGVINLKIEGADKTVPVMIYALDRDPLTDKITHVDFYRVDLSQAVVAEVPLVFIGQSEAVKNEGGILVTSLKSLEMKSLPGNMPKRIEVDIAGLKTFDDVIYISDLTVPKGVEILNEPETAVASVKPPRTEKEIEAAKEGPAEEPAVEEAAVPADEEKNGGQQPAAEGTERPSEEKKADA
ncbi:MAG: 50S ribosomal protein L25 [Candidatus Portnoybacteria bacterium CG10_big_fil_rev_8_21_14_0_10_44_7]|uniref:Large ribosomal subunit protein bL25 n=1 Tax=Candidatus Portnoybacteria bacterium CG10_big_fil_rev_8_21_14_0_10_44_7 TaxID=1974816 RepID=A0A2M8KIB7_9BACT|nr:MAG: 50S ribosomal protein L25 [Candidatus Portnoybacteria bacterium CG10_big_fil_rev_8_21_14_0_10_44_7]